MKISSSKKDPHNKTTDSISWNDYVSQQHDNIHSHGSISQRSFLRSVVKKKKKKFPGSELAAWANLSQVQSIRKARLIYLFIYFPQRRKQKRSKDDTMICCLASRERQGNTANFNGIYLLWNLKNE